MTTTDTYVFARNEPNAEEDRLDLLEELFDRDTGHLLDRIGLPRGGRYLEVGAGHGSVVSFLLARCGAHGQVVATDIDTRWLDRVAHPNLTTVRHHLLDDDIAGLGEFDIVHVRLLLHHLGDRAVDGLERLVSMLAPGGRIVVEEPLWDNRYDPAHPNGARLQAEDAEFEDVMRQHGLDMQVTATFPRRMAELGLVDVDNEIVSAVRRGGDVYSRFIAASVAASSRSLPYEQVYDGGENEAINALLDPTLYYVSWHRLAAWGTRPR